MVMHVNSYMALHYEYGIRNKENYLSSPPWVTNRIICINTTSIYCHTKLDFKLHIFLTKALTLYAFFGTLSEETIISAAFQVSHAVTFVNFGQNWFVSCFYISNYIFSCKTPI